MAAVPVTFPNPNENNETSEKCEETLPELRFEKKLNRINNAYAPIA